jgi:hypothetical protein
MRIKVLLYSLYLNIIKRQYIYTSIENSEFVLVFERNNTGLKKLSSFVWADKWLICLPKCHVSFKACNKLWRVFFIFHILIRIKCNRISEVLLYICIYTEFHFENLKERDKFVDISIDGMIILKWNLRSSGVCGCGLVKYIHVYQDLVKIQWSSGCLLTYHNVTHA